MAAVADVGGGVTVVARVGWRLAGARAGGGEAGLLPGGVVKTGVLSLKLNLCYIFLKLLISQSNLHAIIMIKKVWELQISWHFYLYLAV